MIGTCHHCKRAVDADSGSGTSRLSNHLKACPKRVTERTRATEVIHFTENSR